MPTKKPCTSTAKGTFPPKASKLAHSTPMLAAPEPHRAHHGQAAAARVADVHDGRAHTGGQRGRAGGHLE